jgi:outer membrane protein OmpA-like peptidoglycan-associated protein
LAPNQPIPIRPARDREGAVPASKDAADIAELRKLLTAPAEVGSVLPDAVRAARQKALRDALQPLFEKAFQVSVRNNPQQLADAISPVMGPAIRRAISAALREFSETFNQVFEKSASLRAVRWRIESRISGRPFSEIVLSKSLLYTVEQVFLIHRGTGLLLAQAASQDSVLKDADMVASMLMPLQDYVSDSFTEENQQLNTLDVGRYKLWIQYGPKAMLVGAVSGSAPVRLRNVFRTALDKIHTHLYADLDTFQGGDIAPFEAAQPYLQTCLLGQSRANARRRSWLPWVAAAAGVALIAGLAFYFWGQHRWNKYVESLEHTPGLVIIEAHKGLTKSVIRGLIDKDAPQPAPPPGQKVQFDLKPYLSLDTTFSRERDYNAAAAGIRRTIIRFPVGAASLDPAQASAIEDLAAAIRSIVQSRPNSHVMVIGHTDEVGTEESNTKLSEERAQQVARALATQGVPPARLDTRGVGNKQPLQKGASDWEKASNRSVSFQVTVTQ